MSESDDTADLKPAPRAHLVERAAAAMGSLVGFNVPPPPGPASTDRAPAPPAPRTADSVTLSPLNAGQDVGSGTHQPDAPPPVGLPDEPAVSLDMLKKVGLSVAPTAGRSRISEEIGVVQHQVLRNLLEPKLSDQRGRVVLVTSARPGEGKSFTSLNIAASLAYGGRSVVLVDADAKRGALGDLMSLSGSPGLRALAEDARRRPSDVLMRTAVPRLLLLPYGRPGAKEDGLPAPAALAAAVLRLAEALPDFSIVVDATPCLSTSDPGALASAAGQVVLVVEAEQTQRNEVEAALDMVDACPVLQLVLNKAKLVTNDSFGAYYGS